MRTAKRTGGSVGDRRSGTGMRRVIGLLAKTGYGLVPLRLTPEMRPSLALRVHFAAQAEGNRLGSQT